MDSANVATIPCYFHSSAHPKTSNHFTIFSSSEFSPSSASSSSSSYFISSTNTRSIINISRQNLSAISLRTKSLSESKNVKNMHRRIRSSWKKLFSGSKKFRSIILLNVITLVYASNIAVLKEVEAFTDPAYFSAVRFAVSSIPFLPFIFRARDDAQTRNSGLELGLWISLGYLSEALGLLTSDAGRASFISLFTVIVVPLLESMLGEIVPARTWFGILMSIIGICMLECSGGPPNIGDLFNFISAIFFGIHTLRTEHISRKTRKEDFLPLLGYEVGVAAVLSTIWWLIGSNDVVGIQECSEGISWTWALFWESVLAFPWMPALYTGVFSTGLCLWGEIAAMHEVSATETAVIYGMEPLWGAGFAWFLLGERWGAAGWVGAALILGGSLVVQILGASAAKAVSVAGTGEMEKEMSSHGKVAGMGMRSSPIVVGNSNSKTRQKPVLIKAAAPVMVRSSSRSDRTIM